MAKAGNADAINAEYLEKNNVRQLISDALVQVAVFQPDDPFHFLANHFEWERCKSSPLKYASAILSCQQYPLKTIDLGIHQAFMMLSQCNASHQSAGDMKSVNGAVYMDLIQMLCVELQQEHGEEELRLLENIYVPPRNILSFREFRAGVHCCLLYKAYLKSIKILYATINPESGILEANNRSKSLSVHLLNHLFKQIQIETNQDMKLLTSTEVSTAGDEISLQEFVTFATDLFWKNVSIEKSFQ